MCMSDNAQPSVVPSTPHVCYRHADRETRVSCGRCGKYLCADCVHHGPVGVRCIDCLRGPRLELPPENFQRARTGGILLAIGWLIVLIVVGWRLPEQQGVYFGFSLLARSTPNLLLSLLAGATTGWLIWKMGGRRSSTTSARFAALLGLLIPLLATLILALPNIIYLLTDIAFILRVLLASAFSTAAAWLLATQIYHGS